MTETQSDRQDGDGLLPSSEALTKWCEIRELAILLGRPWQMIFLIDAKISQARLGATLEEK